MRRILRYFLIITLFFLSTGYAQTVPFDSGRWEIKAKESRIEKHLGKMSLFLKGGKAIVKDSQFSDGIIEYDVAFDGKRGFNGVMWRIRDIHNYEKFYIRSHQSGNPDANQYTPVFNGVSGWQLYYSGNGYGAPYKYPVNKWIHIKIVVSGKQGEVYIEDMEKPLFFINQMKTGYTSGKVGLVVEIPFLAPAYFSNFSYQDIKNPELKGKAKEETNHEGSIMSWKVSTPFLESDLEDKYVLGQDFKKQLSWKRLATEKTGLINISRTYGIKEKKNTVFAKVIIHSDKEQIKKMNFGFSSRVKVFLNDKLLFSGQDAFRSRDYRFLGTMGFYDDVYLQLKKGKNELWMAVSEDLQFKGGWGYKVKIENRDGINIKTK